MKHGKEGYGRADLYLDAFNHIVPLVGNRSGKPEWGEFLSVFPNMLCDISESYFCCLPHTLEHLKDSARTFDDLIMFSAYVHYLHRRKPAFDKCVDGFVAVVKASDNVPKVPDDILRWSIVSSLRPHLERIEEIDPASYNVHAMSLDINDIFSEILTKGETRH